MTRRLAAAVAVCAAVLPYLPTLDDYFVQDDFGVVALLSSKPAAYFPRWFVTTWMEDVWGYVPDEIRPFPAVTYQVAAMFGAASPYANHVVNIAFHAVNTVLVLAVAIEAAGLAVAPALVAAACFAVLPMQTESVAWITGRVDSMPACFILAAFLAFVRWRATGRTSSYRWAIAWTFVALFTKQNAITLAPTLVAYDFLVRRERPWPLWTWLQPYLPFVALTAAYLVLRYVLFGEVARESALTAARLQVALGDLVVHLQRMVYGEPGMAMSPIRLAMTVAGVAAAAAIHATWVAGRRAAPLAGAAAFFGVVWIGLGLAPTLVAGYASPRHAYLASVGWAILVAMPVAVLFEWGRRPARWLAAALAIGVIGVYVGQLRREVARWELRADVSHRMVVALSAEADAAPPGTLVLVGAPRASWDFAVPHALRPPFTATDVTARLRVVTASMISCCPHLSAPHTRRLLEAWQTDATAPPVVVMHWDAATGRATRVDDTAEPFVRALVPILAEIQDDASLDAAVVEAIDRLAGGHRGAAR